MKSASRLNRIVSKSAALPWLPELLAGLAGIVYLVQSVSLAFTQWSVIDEGNYIYKGWLFATGQYVPFQDYGPWTNHMPLSFLIFGYSTLKMSAHVYFKYSELNPLTPVECATMKAPLDFLGNPIKAGDTVVYPVRRGSDMWLNKLSVQQVTDDGISGYNATGRKVNVSKLSNVVVAPKPGVEPDRLLLLQATAKITKQLVGSIGFRLEGVPNSEQLLVLIANDMALALQNALSTKSEG